MKTRPETIAVKPHLEQYVPDAQPGRLPMAAYYPG